MNPYQATIAKEIEINGTGLHSGDPVTIKIKPANRVNLGIVFLRTDTDTAIPVKAHPFNISNSELSTTVGHGDSSVSTIEHLMAAFVGLGIDNAIVEVNGPEIPILDGSAGPFVAALQAAGIRQQSQIRSLLIAKKVVEVRDGDRLMRIEPHDRFEIECHIDYASAAIGQQQFNFVFSRPDFLRICESRTFCHINEVEAMREIGLARGGSLDNAIVVNDSSILNMDGLRCSDEFVRHKVLDCVGDLALIGVPMMGRVVVKKPGHALCAQFMRALLSDRDAYEFSRWPAAPTERHERAVAAGVAAFAAVPIFK